MNIKKKMEVGVIGLGKFGYSMANTLTQLGHNVLGLDLDAARVRQLQDSMAQIYVGDSTNKAVLEQLRFQDFDYVVVGLGESMEASLLTTLNLQEIHAQQIIVKSLGAEHSKILIRLGVHRVVQPEVDAARQLAHQLVHPGMLDLLPMAGGIMLQEIAIDNWAGKTLADLALPKQGIMAVAQKKAGAGEDFRFVPEAYQPLDHGDRLLIIGRKENVTSLNP